MQISYFVLLLKPHPTLRRVLVFRADNLREEDGMLSLRRGQRTCYLIERSKVIEIQTFTSGVDAEKRAEQMRFELLAGPKLSISELGVARSSSRPSVRAKQGAVLAEGVALTIGEPKPPFAK